jgi:hypothetical protein
MAAHVMRSRSESTLCTFEFLTEIAKQYSLSCQAIQAESLLGTTVFLEEIVSSRWPLMSRDPRGQRVHFMQQNIQDWSVLCAPRFMI